MTSTPINFDQLKCVLCNKYLSVSPIYHYIDSKDDMSKNICGRCEVTESQSVMRNIAYEAIASGLTFPCSNSNRCPEKIHWNKADHEFYCNFRSIDCHLCGSPSTLNEIQNHCILDHEYQLCYKKLHLTLNVKDSINLQHRFFLVSRGKRYFISVHIDVLDVTKLALRVLPLDKLLKKEHLIVMFNHKGNACSFDKTINLMINSFQCWFFNIGNIKQTIIDTTEFDGSEEIEMELDIRENRWRDTETSDKAEKLISEIRGLLECPDCRIKMKDHIIICSKGHSVCESCYNKINGCPFCRSKIRSFARNSILEEICQKVTDLKNLIPSSSLRTLPVCVGSPFYFACSSPLPDKPNIQMQKVFVKSFKTKH